MEKEKILRLSASSLQDFVDCQRRFELRYVQKQPWPAVQAEPMLEHEEHLERGSRFHRLIQRHQSGIEESILTPLIEDADLLKWWRTYLDFHFLHELEGERYPEFSLSTDIGDARLVATFDLVVVGGERLYVFDWKTYRRSPTREWFLSRLQTRVYQYILARVGVGGKKLSPEQITMIYWIPDPTTLLLPYSTEQFLADDHYLKSLVDQIQKLTTWGLTQDSRHCSFCEYRSLCDRGNIPGKVDDYLVYSTEEPLSLKLDDVEEVGF